MSIARTIREQVTDQLRAELVAGCYPEGTALREIELANRFGVSRGPIRDALLQLSQEGLLAYEANRGVRMRRAPEPEHREFIVSLRIQVEAFVIARGLEKLEPAGEAAVEQSLAALEAACHGTDVATIARCDMAFHESVLAACGGGDFIPLWRQLCARMLLTYSRLDDYRGVYREHEALWKAIRSRDVAAIRTALETNIR